MMNARQRDNVRAICRKLSQELGYHVVEVAFDQEPTGLYLRVYLDKEGGISLTDCEHYHRKLNPLLEQVDYDFLEVSSPGIDRPIKSVEEARAAVGEMVEIRLYKPRQGVKQLVGELRGADDAGYHVLVQGTEVVIPPREIALMRRTFDLDQALSTPIADQQEETDER